MPEHEGLSEPRPQFSVGFPFDDPLGDIESEPPVTERTAVSLSFLSGIVPSYDVQLQSIEGGQNLQNTIPLIDGLIIQQTAVNSAHLVEDRAIRFVINNPDNPDEEYCFEVVVDTQAGESFVDDFGVINRSDEELDLSDDQVMLHDAIMLNMDSRLDEAPDFIPQPIEDGTLRADPAISELLRALNASVEEVVNDTRVGSMSFEAPEPKRIVPLSEPLARRIIQILEPIVFTRLEADLSDSE